MDNGKGVFEYMNSKIYYIDCYKGKNKEGNIGFAKLEDEKIFVMLRGIFARSGMDCKVHLLDRKGQQIEVMTVPVRNGYGQANCLWPDEMNREECYGIYIPLYGGRCGKSQIKQPSDVDISIAVVPQKPQEEFVEEKTPISTFAEELPVIGQDKWSQLCMTYPQIHLFEDVDTVVIKPKDLVVLTQEYHELATNSFVLHAYYNYRQLLLLRYHDKEGAVYYLGVPGIYYDREKRIAHLFGFEGFENGESRLVNGDNRRAYTGCFGYYMKQVGI